jgi:hypothetical protein
VNFEFALDNVVHDLPDDHRFKAKSGVQARPMVPADTQTALADYRAWAQANKWTDVRSAGSLV